MICGFFTIETNTGVNNPIIGTRYQQISLVLGSIFNFFEGRMFKFFKLLIMVKRVASSKSQNLSYQQATKRKKKRNP